MGLFDVKTLSLVALVTSLLLPLVLTTSAQFTSSHTPATRTLIHGALAYAVGFLLLALRGSIPDWLSFFIGNVLIVGGFAELAIGMQMYLRGQVNRRWMVLLTAGNALGMFWFVIVTPDPSQRVFTSSLFLLPICIVLTVEFLAAARRIGASIERGATAEKRLLLALGVVFLLSALSFAWRGQVFWNVRGDINPATVGGRTWGLSFMIGVLLNIMLATCMPLLISRRNQRELAQSQALLQETERLADVGSFLYLPEADRIIPNGVMADWLDVSSQFRIPLSTFLDRIAPSQTTELESHIRAIALGRESQWSGECQMTGPRADARWLSVHCGRSIDASGQTCVIVSSRNVTEFKLATDAAIAARNEADRANAAKSAFLANMSHEIRTPMNGVLGLTRLCLEGELPARERDLVEKCHASAWTLLGVVNDILDFSKIEAGKLALEETPFELARVVDSARNLFEQMAGGKGLCFSIDVGPDLPRFLLGDPLRLTQILNNLLGNAIKFTDAGEIRLGISRQGLDSDRVVLAFSVQDTGIGMSPQQLQGLFQAFSQADASTTRRFGGTGLGLAISRKLAELMGGQLSVHSVEGAGSTFTATLPFALASESTHQHQAVPSRPLQRQLDGLQILLVEDNPTNVLVARLSLEAQGAEVTHCGDGQQAVDYLREHSHATDVVLMDIQMPVMDGYTATHHIRHTLGLSALPIVAMTANVLDADKEATRAAGMSAHVGKPIDMEQLVQVVLQVTGRIPPGAASQQGAASHQAPRPAERSASPEAPLVELTPALERLGGDATLLECAAGSFAQDLPGMLAALKGDAASTVGPLHTLKGLSATLGLTRASHLARELEVAAKAGSAPAREAVQALETILQDSLHALHDEMSMLTPAASGTPDAQETAVDAPSVLRHLAELVAHSDLAVLEHLARNRVLLQNHLGSELAPLEDALQALDLERAAAICSRLLQAK
ncbi:ATP-binding protein [Curvibacter sp. APW13]|uniref:hybrid sensor histidine kinase/response regulator n=1 Tax=Curvibacter sp. APW13 TaxID=3077236 RepID=UPI0028E07C39|nr:ATP-binding protein [Curvibacter sp. APW13]MDT8992188.1 ATP-binding protein [Curvibacter sp. APW13]